MQYTYGRGIHEVVGDHGLGQGHSIYRNINSENETIKINIYDRKNKHPVDTFTFDLDDQKYGIIGYDDLDDDHEGEFDRYGPEDDDEGY